MNYIKEILSLLSPSQRLRLPLLVGLFMGMSSLDLLGIGLIGPYVALVINDGALEGTLGNIVEFLGLTSGTNSVLIFFGWSLVGIFLIKSITAIWINREIIVFGQDQQVFLRSTLMEAYQSLLYSDYLKRNSSEYIYAIEQLSGRAQAVTIVFLRIVSDSIVAFLIIGMLAFQNLAALCLLVGLLGIAVFSYDRVFKEKMKRFGKEANIAATEMVQGINEGIDGLKEIRILGKEPYFHSLVTDASKRLAYFQTKELVIATAPRFLMEFLMIVFIVSLVLGTLYLGQSLQVLIPTLAMFGVAALRLLPIANMVSGSLATLRFQRNSISRLYIEVMEFQSSDISCLEKNVAPVGKPFEEIILENINFRYPGLPNDALKNISLKVTSGESIGFIGASASGKTTLIDLMLGLLTPADGRIIYNGQNIDAVIDDWRSHVAYLPQQVFLIDNTLRRNIALGYLDDDIDDGRIKESLEQARLTSLVNQLPQGLDTELGERGVRLSGGQRQRVALARAFYHQRDVLVMDEATSALDKETESQIVEEIRRLKGKKTMIVIAHRLSTVAECDRIYRLDAGRIVEYGSPGKILGDFDK